MHIPDGFIDAQTSAAAGCIAVVGIAVCLRGARNELDERAAPMAGLVSAFIFAVQMLNFPVAAGTSGHLLGGALAAILVGPYTGALCVTVVLIVQALLFADGGLSALGLNITIMAFTTAAVGWGAHKLVMRFLPKRDSSLPPAAFVGALLSVPAAALMFCAFYAIGGETPVPIRAVVEAMVGVHLLIGIGEAIITAIAVSAVLAARRDLVYAARGLQSTASVRAEAQRIAAERAETDRSRGDSGLAGGPSGAAAGADGTGRARRLGLFGAAALLIALALAGGVSFYASSHPDGLVKVAADKGFDQQERTSPTADSPFAHYETKDVGNERLALAIAGIVGVGATLAIGGALFATTRRRRPRSGSSPADDGRPASGERARGAAGP